MPNILDYLKENFLIFDGAMGTMIQKYKLSKDDFGGYECNDYLNISKPDIITEIHKQYLQAGAQVIETNTFNASELSLQEYGLADKTKEINRAGVRIAKSVAARFSTIEKPCFVSGSVGPGTKLPSLGHINFNEISTAYYSQIETLVEENVDILQIETNQDPLHIKAVLNACYRVFDKQKKTVPIIVQATIQDNGQMLVGTDVLAFLHTFTTMPVDVIGINCGTGPQLMESYIKTLAENSNKYISLLPNAGLPVMENGELAYDLTAQEFAKMTADLVKKYNIRMIGGCCGTTPEFIAALAKELADYKAGPHSFDYKNHLTSLFSAQAIDVYPKPLLVGERANTNGSKKFKKLLEEDKWDEMLETCKEQEDQGAHVLDICLTHLNRNEVNDINTFFPMLNSSIQVPLMIDTTSLDAIEAALKCLSGKAIINSCNFEEGDNNVRNYLQIAKRLNSALICLAIDETGMAKSFEQKLHILNRFIALANEVGVPKENLFFDSLTFSLATGEESYRNSAIESLKMIDYIEKNEPKISSIMGVSNVSFGLNPKIRKYLNAVFLSECVRKGLDAAIVDASKLIPINEIDKDIYEICTKLIYNEKHDDEDALLLLAKSIVVEANATDSTENLNYNEQLENKIIKGNTAELDIVLNKALAEKHAHEIINDLLIPAMQKVGELFENGRLQLPFVLKSAEVMKKSVEYLKPMMAESSSNKNKSMLLATVKGDVHDIGKNLVQIILENNGYNIIDLGVKQTPQQIKEAIIMHKPQSLGLSALLIKSTYYMKETLEFLKNADINIPVICGGAALNKSFVEKELQPVYNGKVVFGKDAFSGLEFMKEVL
ncbi:MAG TPA: homocysteine S-methyltransferase family protein [Candidatus Cloacimonadota bacterium]|nr:homocysteine S-methyltransferase family protein [Candidatus Cloacimonadales bacterium]HPY96227.1 homocysteine S-methyltransferase family protein [Candidatus Cloacimonadota bacterium]HQB41439.1 homocysteine S-methyltransferase family protein [Candidatus Cloacimonadota bacterium]